MYLYRKEIVSYCISTFFVLIAALLHILSYFQLVSFSVNILVFILYTIMILLWRRIMGKSNFENFFFKTFQEYQLFTYWIFSDKDFEV